MMLIRIGMMFAAVLPLLLTGCIHQDLRALELPTPPPASPIDVWSDYSRFLEAVADGAIYDQWQLTKALEYFTELTSIPTKQDMSGLGYILNRKALREDLQAWAEWRTRRTSSHE